MNRLSLTSTLMPVESIDREAKVIRGVSVITGNVVAHGHNAPPFTTDRVLLQQVAKAVNDTGNGVRVRLTHAEVEGVDSLPLLIGKIRNARVDGDQVKADFHFGSYAAASEMNRLFSLAEEAPEDCGLSIVPQDFYFVEQSGELHLRVQSLFAVDWVGTPSANPAGMFSKSTGGVSPPAGSLLKGYEMMNDKQMEYLRAVGLPEGADEEAIATAVAALDETQKAELDALADAPAEGDAAAEGDDEEEKKPAAGTQQKPKPALSAGDKPATIDQIEDMALGAKLGAQWVLATFKTKPSVLKATQLALAEKGKGKGPVVITAGDDLNRTSLSACLPDAIMLRSGYAPKNPHARSKELMGLSVLDMARHHFSARGVKDSFMLSRVEICNMIAPRYFRSKYPALSGAQSTSDFDSILADTINKTLQQAYTEAPRTWQKWARKETAPDFKTVRRTQLHSLPTLTERTEGQPLIYQAVNDSGETYTLAEYHEGVRLTRRALINDDLGAFGRITKMMGDAAGRLEDDVAYGAFTTVGPTMADTGALFNETAVTTVGGHANFTDTGTAISTTSLGVGFSKMYKQTGGKLGTGSALELRPKYLIVASEVEYIARQAISSTELLTSEALTSTGVMKGTSNPFNNSVEVIPTTRIGSTTAWILAADPNQIDTVEVCFLQGEESPVLAQETDFDTDDMKFKVRHTVKAAPIDWRGLYRNDGA